MSNPLEFAMEFVDAGLSVIPLKLDGSKKPNVSSWEPYQCRLPSSDQVKQWFTRKAGIGIITGIVSGGLEVLDFDDGSLFEPWRKQVEKIVCWLPVVETPSGGYHVFYRCDEIGGNVKIAKDPSREKQTLIETRGEGGYVCGVGSPIGIHDLGLYIQVFGPVIPDIPTITPADRKELWRVARSFDKRDIVAELIRERAKKLRYESMPSVPQDGTPWQDFNIRADWSDILSAHGWANGSGNHWVRPGKSNGTSATIATASDGNAVLVVFSGNAGPLSPSIGDHRTWGKFDAWSQLNYGGDKREAAKAARQLGFGGAN